MSYKADLLYQLEDMDFCKASPLYSKKSSCRELFLRKKCLHAFQFKFGQKKRAVSPEAAPCFCSILFYFQKLLCPEQVAAVIQQPHKVNAFLQVLDVQ